METKAIHGPFKNIFIQKKNLTKAPPEAPRPAGTYRKGWPMVGNQYEKPGLSMFELVCGQFTPLVPISRIKVSECGTPADADDTTCAD